jgi:hypothetical protein
MAYRGSDGNVDVYHYATHMLTVEADDEVVPINAGWGSVSDKRGITAILPNGAWIGPTHSQVFTYAQVFGG